MVYLMICLIFLCDLSDYLSGDLSDDLSDDLSGDLSDYLSNDLLDYLSDVSKVVRPQLSLFRSVFYN